jgi:cyclomaltodextrinase / maltogenic alpha-amylase / neopullulanase
MAVWPEHAIFWHVYPLGFLGAPRSRADATPTLPASEPRLRRLEPWLDYLIDLGANGLLLGPVFSSETHGYDTVDHFTVDPRLGSNDDLDALLAVAHERGIRVLLDGVFNHVARSFPGVERLARRDPSGEMAVFEGHGHLVALDHTTPAVADHVVAVMEHWLARGADGWRLDAAYAVPERFWREVLARVRDRHPEAWFLAEVIHGDYAAFVQSSTVDTVTQYELWKAIWSSLNDRNLFELAHALGRHDRLLEVFVPQTFVGNHDVTRIATQITDPGLRPLALVVLMTVAGIPSIYAGDEQGFTGTKREREYGDDEVRPAFPADPAELSMLGADVLTLHRELLGMRRRHPWLVRSRTRVEDVTNTRIRYVAQAGDGRLAVTLDLDAPEGDRWAIVEA